MVPGHLCWPVHRVATSGHYHDSRHTIETRWSLWNLVEAFEVCDAIDTARALAAKEK
jgi:hypothetical protein